MISNLRIGISIIGNKSWIGGISYIELLVKAVNILQKNERPQLFLLTGEENLELVDLHRDLLPFFDNIIFIGQDTVQAEKFLQQTFIHVYNFDELLNYIDFFYPLLLDTWPNICGASWIPDFQHIHLPDFFSSQEIKFRNNNFSRVASFAKIIVLSSKDAEKDFRNLYPNSTAIIRNLSFHNVMPDELYSIDPMVIQNKYKLPDDFLICSNQFWAHKNHMLVFEALAELHHNGKTVHLVCTGSTSDYRFPEYFGQIKQKLLDLELEDTVHIMGMLPRNDQLQLMRRSLAVINPSLFEGWSTVVEDARALGKTIILSDLDVHKEQAPKHAIYFDRYDRNDLVQKIEKILPNLRPGPDLSIEQCAHSEAHQLVKSYALQFCCIAVEAHNIFNKMNSHIEKRLDTSSKSNRIIKNDNTERLNVQLRNDVMNIKQLLISGKLQEAKTVIDKAIIEYPASPEISNLQALLKFQTQDNDGAYAILFQIISDFPAYYPAFVNLALFSWNDGNTVKAIEYFEEALKISNYERSVVLSYGMVLMKLKKFEKAKGLFDNYLKISSDDNEIRPLMQECEHILNKVSKLTQTVDILPFVSHNE